MSSWQCWNRRTRCSCAPRSRQPTHADPEGWSRFRGPNGSGVSTSTRLPSEFGPDKNVIWKTELPFGHSSPALTRDRIFLTAARGERLVTICLDRRTGKIIWERDAPRTREEKLDSRNGPAGPTPATDGTNVLRVLRRFRLAVVRHGRPRALASPARPVQQPLRHGRLTGAGRTTLVVLACDQNTGLLHHRGRAARRPRPLEDAAARGAQRTFDADPLQAGGRRRRR